MDLKKIKVPGYYWRDFTAPKSFTISHIIRKQKAPTGALLYISDWQLYCYENMVSTDFKTEAIPTNLFKLYSVFSQEKKKILFSRIFE